jgi:hypothetical protein
MTKKEMENFGKLGIREAPPLQLPPSRKTAKLPPIQKKPKP